MASIPTYLQRLTIVAMASLALTLSAQARTLSSRKISPQASLAVSAPTQSSPRIWYSASSYPQLSLPDGQHEAIRSVLGIPGPMHFGSFVWNEDGIPKGPLWVRIDLTHQLLSVFRNGHEIGTAVILYGSDGKRTPTGIFHILQTDADHYSQSYNAPMPYMLRLTEDGVAIHGSSVREGWATHGCIGVPLEFARDLFGAAHKGDLVVILEARPKTEAIKH
jgi:hypothetical protein